MIVLSTLLWSTSCTTDGEKTNQDQTQDTGDCLDDITFFQNEVSDIVQSKCLGCHVEGGVAAETRMVLTQDDDTHNFQTLWDVAQIHEAAGYLLWRKPTGQHDAGHVGGSVLALDSEEADAISQFIGRANELLSDCDTEIDLDTVSQDCENVEPGKRLLRRLSHVEFDNSIQDILNGHDVSDG